MENNIPKKKRKQKEAIPSTATLTLNHLLPLPNYHHHHHYYYYYYYHHHSQFTLPSVEVSSTEVSIWEKVKSGVIDSHEAYGALSTAR